MMLKKVLLLFPMLLVADEKILDVYIGSRSIGTQLIFEDKNGTRFDEPISYGLCTSNYLSEIANSYTIKEGKLFVKPKEKCLVKKELSFAQ